MAFLSLDVLVVISFSLFLYTFFNAYFDQESFFLACCSLLDDPKNKLSFLFLTITVGLKVGDFLLKRYVGTLTKSSSSAVAKEMAEIVTSILFSICYIDGAANDNLAPSILLITLCYIQVYIHQVVLNLFVSTKLPTLNQHHNLLMSQFLLFFATLYSILAQFNVKNQIVMCFVIYLMQTFVDCIVDIIRHICFIYDRDNNGSSYSIFIIIKYTEFILQSLGLVAKIIFMLSHYFAVYHVISSGRKLYELITAHMKWKKMLTYIGTEVQDVTEEDIENDNICIICRGEISVGNGKKLACGHCLHIECLERWIANHDKCPICQADLTAMITNIHDMEKEEEMQNVNNEQHQDQDQGHIQDIYQRANPHRVRRVIQQNNEEINVAPVQHYDNIIEEEKVHKDEVLQHNNDKPRTVYNIIEEEKVHSVTKHKDEVLQQNNDKPRTVYNVKKVVVRTIKLPDGTYVKQLVSYDKAKSIMKNKK